MQYRDVNALSTDRAQSDSREFRGASGSSRDPARPVSVRRILGSGGAGALGGALLALLQHVGLEPMTDPAVLRWGFLYVLIGGTIGCTWDTTTRWLAAQLRLHRVGRAVLSALLAGTLLLAATLFVEAAVPNGGRATGILTAIPWLDGVKAFLVGGVGGGLWEYVRRM